MTANKQTKLEKIAAVLGVSPADISLENPDFKRLLEEAVVCQVHVSRWRARVALQPRDLGLTYTPNDWNQVSNAIRLGDLLVAPKSFEYRNEAGELITVNPASIETQVRRLPKKYGFKTPFGYMIPAPAFGEFYSELKRLAEMYEAFAEYLYENWLDKIRPAIFERLAGAARIAYKKYIGKKANEMTEEELNGEDNFVERLIQSQIKNIPSREYVRSAYKIWCDTSYIELPENFDEIRNDALSAQSEKLDLWDRMSRNQQNEAMRNIARNNFEKSFETFSEDFITETVTGIFEEARTTFDSLQESIQKNERVHPRSIVALKALRRNLQTFKSYAGDFGNIDQTMDELIEATDNVLLDSPEYRTMFKEEYARTAAGASEKLSAKLAQLSEKALAPRQAREIEPAPEWASVAENARRNRRTSSSIAIELPNVEPVRRRRKQ